MNKRYHLPNTIFAFLIGLLSCSNLIYLFVIGNTPIIPLVIVAFVCFAFLLLTNQINKNVLKTITNDLKLLFLGVLLSIIPTIVFNPQNIRLYIVGLISVSFSVVTLFDVIALKKQTKSIFAGIAIGIVVNVIFVVLEYVFYERTRSSLGLNGTSFNFGDFFPYSQHAKIWLSNPYAAKGLFREQGHLMRFLAVFSLPLLIALSSKKNKVVKFLMSLAVIVLSAMTRSATIAIFAFGLILFFALLHIKSLKSFLKMLIIGLLALCALLLVSRFVPQISNLVSSFTTGFSDLFTSDGSNGIRLQGMQRALSIITNYPITGSGLNSLTTLFMNSGYYGANDVYGSYSSMLSMIAELGIFSFSFFFFAIHKSLYLIRKAHNVYSIGLGVSLLMFFALFCLTDFNIEPSTSILLGLVLVEYERAKKRISISKRVSSITTDKQIFVECL